MRSKRISRYIPQAWQKDSSKIDTKNVQYWRNGVMAGVISQTAARRMVEEGEAFVISSQAVGAMQDGYSIS